MRCINTAVRRTQLRIWRQICSSFGTYVDVRGFPLNSWPTAVTMAAISPKVYAKGSTEPPLTPNTLRLYGNRFCPYVYRVRLVLAAKDIPYETVNIHLKDKPEWYLAKYSSGKVPLVERNDKKLIESIIISEYIEEKFPDKKLWSNDDPYEKAVGRIIIKEFSKVDDYMKKIREKQDQASYDGLTAEIKRLDRHLQKKQTPFFTGQKPGMVDYMIWPFVEGMSTLYHSSVIKQNQEPFNRDEVSRFSDWMALMRDDPVVRKCSISDAIRKEFLESYVAGNINFDLGL